MSYRLANLSAECSLWIAFHRADHWWLLQKWGGEGMRKSLPFPLGLCPSEWQGNVCLCQGWAIKHIPRKQNTWIQNCFCFMWFNPCSPCSLLATKQCVCLKNGWASPALLLKPCNGAGTKKMTYMGQKQATGDLVGNLQSIVSAMLQGYFTDQMPYLHCFAYHSQIAASACVCLKKGLYFWGLSEAV